MKIFQEGYLASSSLRQSESLNLEIPSWISEMGLGWLYVLLARFDSSILQASSK